MGFNENLPSGNLKVCYGESSIGKPSKCMSDLGQQNLEILKYVLCHFLSWFVIVLSLGCVICHVLVIWVCHVCVSCFCQSCVLQMPVSNKNEKLQNNAQMTKKHKAKHDFRHCQALPQINAGHQKNKNHNLYIYIYNIYITEK